MITYLKDEILNELIGNGKVLVDFYAEWCMPCKMLGETLEEIVSLNKDVKIIKVNVDEHPELARSYVVMSIPHLILYNDKNIVEQHIGMMEKEKLLDWIK